jgi:hypothetical protein
LAKKLFTTLPRGCAQVGIDPPCGKVGRFTADSFGDGTGFRWPSGVTVKGLNEINNLRKSLVVANG